MNNRDKEMRAVPSAWPKISIGLMTYNHEQFIRACLESIRAQNYPDLELIISDDASTDGTAAVIREFMDAHPGFVSELIRQPVNLGVAHNANSLLDKLGGVYGFIFSGDDLFLPGKLHKQTVLMEKNPRAIMCFSNMEWFWSDTGRKICNHFGIVQSPSTKIEKVIADCTIPSPTMFIRLSEIRDIRYNVSLTHVNDFLFIIDMMLRAPVVFLNDSTVRYRKHRQSLTMQEFFYCDRERLLVILKNKLPASYQKAIQGYEYITLYAKIMTLIQQGKKKQAVKEARPLYKVLFRSPKWTLRCGAIILKLLKPS